jgi:hypothetical protein
VKRVNGDSNWENDSEMIIVKNGGNERGTARMFLL